MSSFTNNIPAQRWIALQEIGPGPCGRAAHAMASDGIRVFVLGGELSPGAQADDAKLIHVLDTSMYFLCPFIWTASKFENTEHPDFPESHSDSVYLSEKTK